MSPFLKSARAVTHVASLSCLQQRPRLVSPLLLLVGFVGVVQPSPGTKPGVLAEAEPRTEHNRNPLYSR